MKTIWKYEMPKPGQTIVIEIPHVANFLSVQMQDGEIVLWALVDPEAKKVPMAFATVGTGKHLPNDPGVYCGTVQDGPHVWHIFRVWYDLKTIQPL